MPFSAHSTYSKVVSAQYKTRILGAISLFPNPTKGYVTINLNSNEIEKGFQIQVLNTIGQVVLERKYTYMQSINLDMSNLTIGHYFIKISTKDASQTLNLMKN